MAAPPARARADYDCLIKLLLIGDSGARFFSKSVPNFMLEFSVICGLDVSYMNLSCRFWNFQLHLMGNVCIVSAPIIVDMWVEYTDDLHYNNFMGICMIEHDFFCTIY